MPTPDDEIIIRGGPLKAVIKWLWNYRLMVGKYSFRSLYLFVASHIATALIALAF